MKNATVNKSNATAITLPVSHFEVTRVKWWDKKSANFNLILNNCITIYGMRYYDAGKGGFISFPQTKDKDGKYWNVVYIPLTDEDRKQIVLAVENAEA